MSSSNLSGAVQKKLTELEQQGIEAQAKELAKKTGWPYLKVSPSLVDLSALAILPEEASRSSKTAVIAQEKKSLTVVLVDPAASLAKQVLDKLTAQGFQCQRRVISLPGMEKIWERYQEIIPDKADLLGTVSIDQETINQIQQAIQNIADLKEKLTALPTTQLLEALLAGAVKIGASDIHLEPEESSVRTRYRLDGVLNDVFKIDADPYRKLLSRLKITSGLKINIHNAPQDGRFTVRYAQQLIEVRTSVLPGAYGENVVMRILDPSGIKQTIEELGLSPENTALLKKLLKKTTGAILTTGPTGSGKTTTLYAFIHDINEPGAKIITIEDPVEYHVVGISQTQVNPAQGYTFASGLRSIVRQDPDIILVGEIRDGETAEIAMQAALTGHLVFSTLHTNDAAGAIPRLIDLGAKPTSVAPALNVVIAQRLVRKICPHCAQKKPLQSEDFAEIKSALADAKIATPSLTVKTVIAYPGQCAACNFTGYKGRLGIFELFVIDAEMEKLILKSPAISEMRELAVKKGMLTMRQDGYLKVLESRTSLEEVQRVLA